MEGKKSLHVAGENHYSDFYLTKATIKNSNYDANRPTVIFSNIEHVEQVFVADKTVFQLTKLSIFYRLEKSTNNTSLCVYKYTFRLEFFKKIRSWNPFSKNLTIAFEILTKYWKYL